MARLFFWLIENVGREQAMGFIRRVSQLERPVHMITPSVEWDLVRQEFTAMVHNLEDASDLVRNAHLDTILNEDTEATQTALQKAKTYARRLGTDLASASQGHTFINGKHFTLDDVSICICIKGRSATLISFPCRNSFGKCRERFHGRCSISKRRLAPTFALGYVS